MNENTFGLFQKYLKSINRYDPKFLEELYKVIDTVHGWLVPYQVYLLYAIISHAKGKVVEIGSWKGRSTSVFCFGSEKKDIDLYCVDTWKGSEEHKDIDTSNLLNEFKNNLQRFNFLDRINIQQGPSIEIAKMHDNESCDLIFVDAAHDYENVKADILSWYPKLKRGGVMLGHDYPDPSANDFQGLKNAVDEEVRDNADLFEDFGYFCGIWGAIKK
jgi:predicted O-methyltransferase YrrM